MSACLKKDLEDLESCKSPWPGIDPLAWSHHKCRPWLGYFEAAAMDSWELGESGSSAVLFLVASDDDERSDDKGVCVDI